MSKIDCLHSLIDHLARNGAVIVLSPFNSAEVDPSVDLGKLQLVAWPVTQFPFNDGSHSSQSVLIEESGARTSSPASPNS